jgi:hypothetical protein
MKGKPVFHSLEEAMAYLEQRGTLKFFGRAGSNYEYCVFTFISKAKRLYHLNIHMDGRIVVTR